MTAQRRGVFQVTLLRRLDLKQPDERRLVLLVEHDHAQHPRPCRLADEPLSLVY